MDVTCARIIEKMSYRWVSDLDFGTRKDGTYVLEGLKDDNGLQSEQLLEDVLLAEARSESECEDDRGYDGDGC